MPNFTDFLKLRKPLQEEFYNIDEHNDNMDIIDDKMKELSESSGVVISPDEPETGDVWIDTDDNEGEGAKVVTSVNGMTGDVTLDAGGVGAYDKASTYSKEQINDLLSNFTKVATGSYVGDGTGDNSNDFKTLDGLKTYGRQIILPFEASAILIFSNKVYGFSYLKHGVPLGIISNVDWAEKMGSTTTYYSHLSGNIFYTCALMPSDQAYIGHNLSGVTYYWIAFK